MKRNNLLWQTDSYKLSHFLQFPPNTENNFYYMEARGGGDMVKFVGCQMLLEKIFSNMPTIQEINRAARLYAAHGEPFNRDGWIKLMMLGYYPLEIKAVKEGTIQLTKRPLVTTCATIDGFEWLPGWAETRLMQMWYPITVATRSWECKKVINRWLQANGDPSLIDFKLHDFGYRGATCQEAAEIGGFAHLTNFMGTDTLAGIWAAQDYYDTDEMVGFSIPAGEHSVYTAWGRDNEVGAYRNMIKQFGGRFPFFAAVSDSYDLSNAVVNIWGKELKEEVLKCGSVAIIRPDSGDPVTVVLRTIKQLEDAFGCEKNRKGFKVLNPSVRIIQGDGISSADNIDEILTVLHTKGYSADNIAFGMGAGLLQKLDRDTYKFAIKNSCTKRDGIWRGVSKCPADAPWKASKEGRFENDTELAPVWRDGKFLKRYVFQEVKANDTTFV